MPMFERLLWFVLVVLPVALVLLAASQFSPALVCSIDDPSPILKCLCEIE